ncbi:hypothetical protein C1646_806572 [Rhizophagus diaphanus]|nr:hypothetical protein C1646_806572 [Rhizophagus diaphanus] [Rhizophagus sp. MUCL 43196]
MPTDLYTKIYIFLLNAEEEDITAGSIIYQEIEDNPWISQNELKMKTNRERPLTSNKIEKNIKALKGKFRKDTSQLYQHLFSSVNAVSIFELTWKDPLANQKLVENMVPSSLPRIIWEKCDEFVVNFAESNISVLPQKLSHNGEWKESDKELADITSRTLSSLNDSWNNSAFSSEFAKSQNEGTYVTNVIVPAIQVTLKGLPLGRSSYVSRLASADRKGEGQTGRQPDIMFVMKHDGKKYELIYVESSRLSCTPQKKKDDEIKLWHETNDGMHWMHKLSGLDKGEFGIIGIQVAGRIIRLNVLIRDVGNVHRYYHLYKAEISVQ